MLCTAKNVWGRGFLQAAPCDSVKLLKPNGWWGEKPVPGRGTAETKTVRCVRHVLETAGKQCGWNWAGGFLMVEPSLPVALVSITGDHADVPKCGGHLSLETEAVLRMGRLCCLVWGSVAPSCGIRMGPLMVGPRLGARHTGGNNAAPTLRKQRL